MDAVTGANLKIARRANAQARADFATWQMMAKLGSGPTLSPEAQAALADYSKRVAAGTAEADEETIQTLYRRYYVEMGGTGIAPDSATLQPKVISRRATAEAARTSNVTPFRPRQKEQPEPTKRSMPAGLIFIALVGIVVLFKYLFA